MTFNIEVRPITNSRKLINGETDIYLYNAMTANAGKVMVMVIAANTIVMGSIGKFNAIEQACIDQHLYRTIDRCPPHTRLPLSQFLPEIINGEIRSTFGKFHQSLRNESPWTCITPACLLECRINFMR